jgi:hypothetical protein
MIPFFVSQFRVRVLFSHTNDVFSGMANPGMNAEEPIQITKSE